VHPIREMEGPGIKGGVFLMKEHGREAFGGS
jgi:hypothetical protein